MGSLQYLGLYKIDGLNSLAACNFPGHEMWINCLHEIDTFGTQKTGILHSSFIRLIVSYLS